MNAEDIRREQEDNIKDFLLWSVNEMNVRPKEVPVGLLVRATVEALEAATENKVVGNPHEFFNAIVKKHKDKYLNPNNESDHAHSAT